MIHNTTRVGQPKTESARKTIEELNPDVKVVEHRIRLDASNILEIIKDYDVIVDGADNFPTRYLLNDASVRLRKPVVSASILAFDGQISTFVPFEGPCYRCLYPTPPPAELAPSCGAAGVLGVMAGVMGLLQANEVIKLVAGIGEPLIGRLLLGDGQVPGLRAFLRRIAAAKLHAPCPRAPTPAVTSVVAVFGPGARRRWGHFLRRSRRVRNRR